MPTRKYVLDENYFEQIDTEEKAYILGFLYADGCNSVSVSGGCTVSLQLAKQDEEILIKISKIIYYNNVYLREYKRDVTRQNMVILSLNSKKISNDLIKWGCVPNKTFVLKFPSLSDNLKSHFIRGYFDGDGSLTFTQAKNRNQITALFAIVSTIEMLDSIGQKCKDLDIHYRISKRHKDRDNNNYTLTISGNIQIKKFCEFLYKDANIYLQRKYKNFVKLKELKLREPVSDEEILKALNDNPKIVSITKLSSIIKMDRHVLSRRLKELESK